MDTLNISTGEKHIGITRDGVNVGEIVFNPNDSVFAEKYYRLIEKLDAKQKELATLANEIASRTTIDENGIPNTALEIIAFARTAHEAICVEYDNLFGVGTSEMVFGDFVPINEEGLEVHTQFVNGFAPFIQKTRAEKIQKYTGNGHGKRKRK